MTFDDFIITRDNRVAHAACRAVLEAPTKAYNPLWMYGRTRNRLPLTEALSDALSRSGAAFVVLDADAGIDDSTIQMLVDDAVQVVLLSAAAPVGRACMQTGMALAIDVG